MADRMERLGHCESSSQRQDGMEAEFYGLMRLLAGRVMMMMKCNVNTTANAIRV